MGGAKTFCKAAATLMQAIGMRRAELRGKVMGSCVKRGNDPLTNSVAWTLRQIKSSSGLPK